MKYYKIGFVFADGWENFICSVRGMKNARVEVQRIEREYGVKPIIREIKE